jgi:hypothetical protein
MMGMWFLLLSDQVLSWVRQSVKVWQTESGSKSVTWKTLIPGFLRTEPGKGVLALVRLDSVQISGG